jgi:GAF domain-containing protein/HAMP domain-containing protein
MAKTRHTRSIKARLLTLSLGMTVIAVLVIAIIAINSAQSVGRQAQQVSSQAISAQAEEYLQQYTLSSARENDLVLNQVARDIQKVAALAATIFDNPGQYDSQTFWPVDQHMSTGDKGQYLNSKADITSVFVPNTQPVDEETLRDIRLSAYLEPVLKATFENNPIAEAIYFATPRDVVRYYPNIELGKVVPSDFRATGRVWFTGSGPVRDPTRSAWWTPAYADATGLGVVTTAAIPIYTKNNEFVGVVGFDITLTGMKKAVEATQILRNGYSFLIDADGKAVALPDQGYNDILGRPPVQGENGATLSDTKSPFRPVILAMLKGQIGTQTIEVGGKKYTVAYAPLPSNNWSLGSVVSSEDVLMPVARLQAEMDQNTRSLLLNRAAPIMAVVLLVMMILVTVLTSRMLAPIQKLTGAVERVGAGEWDVKIPQESTDEIGVLAQTFQTMTLQLRSLVGNLEQRVAERTRRLERRSLQLQTAAEVARDITTIQNLDDLLNKAVNLVRGRFGFYHAGLFLIDDLGEYACLRAATGEAGRQLIERGHKLEVGEIGLVGYVTGTGQPRIALDVGADAVHFKNPLLPDTRSEMALPLKVNDRVIGALDVQSSVGSAFDQEDTAILQILADQLAVAINNIRLVEKLETALKETDTLYQHQVQQNWSIQGGAKPTGYEYDRLRVKAGDFNPPPEMLTIMQNGHAVIIEANNWTGETRHSSTLAAPLVLRGQVIGIIGLEKEDPGYAWTDDEIAVVEAAAAQATLTLENARLLEKSQRRAANEQLIGDISSRMRQTLDIDTVLQTATEEIYKALSLHEVTIKLADTDGTGNGNGHGNGNGNGHG